MKMNCLLKNLLVKGMSFESNSASMTIYQADSYDANDVCNFLR